VGQHPGLHPLGTLVIDGAGRANAFPRTGGPWDPRPQDGDDPRGNASKMHGAWMPCLPPPRALEG
jgi:hypothetical protein